MTTAPGPAVSPLPPSRFPLFGRIFAHAALILYFLGSVTVILDKSDWQSDALLRHYCIRAWHAGLNPYDPAEISRVSGTDFDTAYVYPPDTLPVFGVFSSFGLEGVRPFYLGFQLLLLVSLLVCWQRFFLEPGDRFHPLFFVLCLAGLGNTLLTELRVGNISLVEQTLLWWGLAAWLRGRYKLFAVLLWLAAACKLTPLAFSVLLLLPPARRWGLFACVWLAMAARLALDRWCSPMLFHEFTSALSGGIGGAHDGGRNNPCAIELLKSVVQLFSPLLEGPHFATVVLPLYAVLVAAVLGMSFVAWQTINRRHASDAANPPDDERGVRLIFLVCLAYTLTAPRMKDYSYILLLPVVWRVGKRTLARSPHAWFAFVLLACLASYSYIPSLQVLYGLLWDYLPYLIALAAWVLLLLESAGSVPSPERLTPPSDSPRGMRGSEATCTPPA